MLSFLPNRRLMFRAAMSILLVLGFLPQTYAHSASKSILVLGDSLSAEYGLSRGQGWVSLLEKKLADSSMNTSVINASISALMLALMTLVFMEESANFFSNKLTQPCPRLRPYSADKLSPSTRMDFDAECA